MSAEWQFVIALNERLRPLKDPVEIQQVAVRLIAEYLHANRVNYAHIDGDQFVISQSYANGVAPASGRGPLSRFGRAIVEASRRGETVAVNDVHTDVRIPAAQRAQLLSTDIAAFIGVPLVKDGRWIATFSIHSATPRTWTGDQIALVEVTAERTWAAAERAGTQEALARSDSRLAFLLRLNDALRPLSNPAAVQETAARLLGEHLGVARVGYAELEVREYMIRREHTRGAEPLVGLSRITVGDTLREALLRGETVVVSDVETDPRLGDDDRATMRMRQIAAFVAVALLKDGRMVAAFGANHNAPRAWTDAEIDLVRDVAERTWDAVERARAETAIRAQQQRLRLALEASAGGSWTWAVATNEVDWDERFRALYGFTPDEPARTDAWLPRVHESDRPQALALLHEIMTSKTKDSWENTFRIVRPDGTLAWIQSRGRAERDADGNLTRLTGLDLDFTHHRLIEETSQLRRDEEHDRALRTLLETATQGIVSVDARGVIVFANRAFESMFGWPPEELIGESIERLMPGLLRDGYERPAGLSLVGARKDGSRFPVEVTVNHVPTSGGGRTFAFVTNITERQRAAWALQERTAELEYRTTQLSQMAWDLTLAEHHAREQIARTLHDGLQQLLVIVALNLEQLLKREGEPGAPSDLLLETKHQLDEAIAAARSLNLELFPPVLQHSGLPAAVNWRAGCTTSTS